jgi:hypothetical protein
MRKSNHEHLIVSKRGGPRPDLPTHIRGVRRGNDPERGPDPAGHLEARRSTGICTEDHEPIDPSMPKLSPA